MCWRVIGGSRPAPGRRAAASRPRAVEPLEGRALLSSFGGNPVRLALVASANIHNHDVPLYGNGIAVKLHPHFYPYYQGPRRPDLNAVAASAVDDGKSLVLSGTVAGPITAKPKTSADGAVYAFLVNRGGANTIGFYPGRPNVRFDTIVAVSVQPKGVSASLQLTDPVTHQPVKPVALKASSVTIKGDVVQVKVPMSLLPSNGKAYDQWMVNFSPRIPAHAATARTVASFLPEFGDFQVYVPPASRKP